ncbi:hypothetical protein KUH03_39865 [Sphingobacterium sp. E70]|uniref:hypothetical protein n=1 Tax=Sphingobacterium sp. E70 TaxID=2853439 RepID=UPI00211CFE6E|nr:hypothetical protein [Sphingobacterium sp. E70]ULT24968.1 hypothetical protein KUH03_39865 [Sphingobacterium sp. E70]
MKSRYIVTPKDKATVELLDYNKAADDDLIEFVLTEEQFNVLNCHNVFSGLNEILGCDIDDFEDESITDGTQLEMGLNYLNAIIVNDEGARKLLEKLIYLFQEAISRKTGVYFYF